MTNDYSETGLDESYDELNDTAIESAEYELE
jgi:hypothetical protein